MFRAMKAAREAFHSSASGCHGGAAVWQARLNVKPVSRAHSLFPPSVADIPTTTWGSI